MKVASELLPNPGKDAGQTLMDGSYKNPSGPCNPRGYGNDSCTIHTPFIPPTLWAGDIY
jgi:hypothetical protein